tara:strand:+ start:249 stop:647 length:399 start_codon:yes stop_codon:yes gene_type:complete
VTKPKEDPNYVIKIEKAIVEKYGVETIQHPGQDWTPEKEQEYIEQLRLLNKKNRKLSEKTEKVEVQGVLISKKLLSKDSNRVCSTCETYSFNSKDDIYMNKYDCCFQCYVQWVEDREERWATGWRPNKGENK